MKLEEAKELLGNAIQPDGSLKVDHPPFLLRYDTDLATADLDGSFVADELEAIALYMRSAKSFSG